MGSRDAINVSKMMYWLIMRLVVSTYSYMRHSGTCFEGMVRTLVVMRGRQPVRGALCISIRVTMRTRGDYMRFG